MTVGEVGGAAMWLSFLQIVAVLGLVASGLWWHHTRSATLLERWAEENGFTIADRRLRQLFRGPFTGTTALGQTVYRVTVVDGSGQERSGWVRCGSFAFGLLSDKVRVRWDEPAPPSETP
jgi:hypothetical protein